MIDTEGGWWCCRAGGGVEKRMLRQRQSWWCTRHHASKQGLAVSDHYESTTAALHVYVSCASNVWALFRCSSFT